MTRRRKFLVVIDETPECERALLFAAKQAERTGGTVVTLTVMAATEFQHWLGVENIMREEAEQEAHEMMDRVFAALGDRVDEEPERLIAFGNRSDAIRTAITEDPDIAQLVLAASTGTEGPGPLVSAIAGAQAGRFPVPITIVPGGLSDEDIEAIA